MANSKDKQKTVAKHLYMKGTRSTDRGTYRSKPPVRQPVAEH